MDLVIDLVLDIARQGAPAHNLHIVGKVASVMKLRCMAHRDVLRGNRVWLSCFYRMSRVDSISRNHPYTIDMMDVAFALTQSITVLHYGRVIADGLVDEVKANPLVQQIYLGSE